MTDWMPWGAVFMGGVFATLWHLLKAVGEAPAGSRPQLATARRTFWASLGLTLLAYLLYLAFGERWLPYG